MFNELARPCKKQSDYIKKCQTSWLNIAEGGKRGGKNVTNDLAFCIALENHPNKLHLVAGYDTSSAKLNILDCDGFGILNYFSGRCKEGKYKNRECLYINTKTGVKVLLISGGGKANSYKSIKGNTYGMAYITEANECHPDFLKEVEDRTISSDDRKIFHDLNPKSPKHWYYTDYLDFHERQQKDNPNYGLNYCHFNIFDNMSISNEKLKKVLSTYDKSSIWYSRDILGKRVANESFLFRPIIENELEYITETPKIGYISMGIDFGGNNSAHSFVTSSIMRDFSEVNVLRSDKTPIIDDIHKKLKQLKEVFKRHLLFVLNKYGKIDIIWADCAEQILISALQEVLDELGLSIPIKDSVKTPISGRIYAINMLLMIKKIKFVKNDTETIVRALQEAVQDSEADDDRWLDDGTSDIDSIDGFNYGIEYWFKQILKVVLEGGYSE
ncbi:MAG: phage terminase large subunit [Bacilli bacterium]|nr:phage terminase large subunit [Bacilli bacterium]